ncbi:TPA: hypothetical protein DD394_03180 [bacterium UBP9_UBA11836]|nr:hypothetical protein [bacterium UBP9_UBA11836]
MKVYKLDNNNTQLDTERAAETAAVQTCATEPQLRPASNNASKSGKGCYIAVIVVLVLIILGMAGSAIGLTCFAIICGSESTPEDKSDASNYQLYVIDEVYADGKAASKNDKLTK